MPESRAQEARQSTAVIISAARIGQNTPAAETPIEVQPSARPRLVTNHFETVTLASRKPQSAAPGATKTPRITTHCQRSVIWLMMNSEGTSTETPISMIRRGPTRSM